MAPTARTAINKRLYSRYNGITFDGILADCDVCVVGQSGQFAQPNMAETADTKASFELEYSGSKITD